MNHLIILPILLPFLTGALLLLGYKLDKSLKRMISLTSISALIVIAMLLINDAASGTISLYKVGNWKPPFGISLMLDRLSALMVFVSSTLGTACLIYASRRDDLKGMNFHALFHFQVMGINGAFLTGDLFNLFVFFEVLLISSYALLLQETQAKQLKAGTHYIILNLVGSSIFLIALSLIYGILGSVNMIDVANLIKNMSPENTPFIKAAGFLLLIVFGLKAAMFPLHSWLPLTYAAAPSSVSALFAIMTKVGFYAILRVWTMLFGDDSGELTFFGYDLIWYFALMTIVVGAIGTLAAKHIRVMLGYLVILSVGSLFAALSVNTQTSLTAALVYMLHSTWIMGAFYMLTGIIVSQRGAAGEEIYIGHSLEQPKLLGALFFLIAIAVVGLPPFSGFLGKMLILSSVNPTSTMQMPLWTLILIGGFLSLISLSRAGSHLFWRSATFPAHSEEVEKADIACILAVSMLIVLSQSLVVFANFVIAYMRATATQLLEINNYLPLVN